jgi:hypothetical protein
MFLIGQTLQEKDFGTADVPVEEWWWSGLTI